MPSRLSGWPATGSSDGSDGSNPSSIGAIVGGSLGGLFLIGLVAASIPLYRIYVRRRRGVRFKVYGESSEQMVDVQGPSTPDVTTSEYALTPMTLPSATIYSPTHRELRYVPPESPRSEHSAGDSVLTNPWGPSTVSGGESVLTNPWGSSTVSGGGGADSSARQVPPLPRRRTPSGTPQSPSDPPESPLGRQAPPLPRKVRGGPQARPAELHATDGDGENSALRSEIDALRREMDELRMNQAPPQYSGES